MRVAGFLLLLGGFAWHCWSAFSLPPIARAVLVSHYDRFLPAPGVTYSREDVKRAMREVTIEVVERGPSYVYPGMAMLGGGLFLAFARKRSTSRTDAA